MRKGLLGSLAALFAGAAVGTAQVATLPPATLPPAAAATDEAPALLPAQPSPAARTTITDGKLDTASCPTCLPDPADVCCKRHERIWASAEFLLWFNRNEAVNAPLATLGPVAGFGFLNAPATPVALGGGDVNFGTFDGARATVGGWLNTEATLGLEASGFLLERRSTSKTLSDTPLPADPNLLARPFLDAVTKAENAAVVAFPGAVNGTIYDKATSRTWGAEADVVWNWRDRSQYRVDLLGGFRYFDLREKFEVGQLSTFAPANTAGVAIYDEFGARNQFYGGQVGARTTVTRGRLDLTLTGKLALGYTHEVTDVVGNTIGFAPAPATPLTFPAGFLATAPNSGHDTRDRFSVLPESTIAVGYRLTDRLSASVGYNFIYLSSVARPAEQIDRTINPNFVPILAAGGPLVPARPARETVSTDYWVQGVNFGVSYKY